MTTPIAVRILEQKDADGNILGVLLSQKYDESPHGPIQTRHAIENPESIFRIHPTAGSIDEKDRHIIPIVSDHTSPEYKTLFSGLAPNTILYTLSGNISPTPDNTIPTLQMVISKSRKDTFRKRTIDITGMHAIIPPLSDGSPDISTLESKAFPDEGKGFFDQLISEDHAAYILEANTAQTQSEAALVLLTTDPDIGNVILADTGPYLFYAREQGNSPEDRSMSDIPENATGLFLFSNGKVWTSGNPGDFMEDYNDGIDGEWERISPTDSRITRFGIENTPEGIRRRICDMTEADIALNDDTFTSLLSQT